MRDTKQNGQVFSTILSDKGYEFSYFELPKNTEFKNGKQDMNLIVFVLKGQVRAYYDGSTYRVLRAGQMMFLPKLTCVHGEVTEETALILHLFGESSTLFDRQILGTLYPLCRDTPYLYPKLRTCQCLSFFLDSTRNYFLDGLDSSEMWELKHRELLWILDKYYQKDELASFFQPLLGASMEFKERILANFKMAQNASELAMLCGYTPKTFNRRFKKQFGITAFTWIQEQKIKQIRYMLSFPDVPFKNIIDDFGFNSAQHFTQYCKAYLGDSPSKLRERLIFANALK